jgi:hypothetical protein
MYIHCTILCILLPQLLLQNWGGDITGAKTNPINFGSANLNDRLVYSPHVYGIYPNYYPYKLYTNRYLVATLVVLALHANANANQYSAGIASMCYTYSCTQLVNTRCRSRCTNRCTPTVTGPDVSPQPYFNDGAFPGNLYSKWDEQVKL